MLKPPENSHPKGETRTSNISEKLLDTSIAVDTFGGRVHVEWDEQSAATPLGQCNVSKNLILNHSFCLK